MHRGSGQLTFRIRTAGATGRAAGLAYQNRGVSGAQLTRNFTVSPGTRFESARAASSLPANSPRCTPDNECSLSRKDREQFACASLRPIFMLAATAKGRRTNPRRDRTTRIAKGWLRDPAKM